MELRYIVMTIIKILISVPAVLLAINLYEVDAAALIDGHLDTASANFSGKSNITSSYDFKIDLSDSNSQEITSNATVEEVPHDFSTKQTTSTTQATESEEVPDPSPLVVPGYNLPDNIFNKGKPFYLEKDPVTGKIDFNSKTPSLNIYEDYEYLSDESNNFDKSQIDRKDGPSAIKGHRPSDINQLTPNFHDFLNLPVKYNSEKYVYPLISSSYANFKVQGNVNKYNNHKNYVVTTYKPTISPTYYTTKTHQYQDRVTEGTTTPRFSYDILTTRRQNLLQSPMNHPSFNEEFHVDDVKETYFTRKPSTTTVRTTTKRALSLFEQLFGSDYDDPVTMTTTTTTTTTVESVKFTPPNLFTNLPANKVQNFSQHENVLTGSQMNYDMDEDVEETPKPIIRLDQKYDQSNKYVLYNSKPTYNPEYDDPVTDNIMVESNQESVSKPMGVIVATDKSNEDVDDYDYEEEHTTLSYRTSSTTKIAEISPTSKVTSLPLGENHVTHKRPIIVASTNLKDQLNHEKVIVDNSKFQGVQGVLHQGPSSSSVHILPNQDTVSFVMGNQQNNEPVGTYVGSSVKESPYDNNPFRPVYQVSENNKESVVSYMMQANAQPGLFKPPKNHEGLGTSMVVDPIDHDPKPSHVINETDGTNAELPKTTGHRIVFPDDKSSTTIISSTTTASPDLSPPPPPLPPNREVLKLNSKPMFHQLPSELMPPNERDRLHQLLPQRIDRIRPPWDPRPGHFHAGRPEYARPPRPAADVYKRMDNLPNILPQFRPGSPKKPPSHHHMQHYHHHQENPNFHKSGGYVRQPLLERPSNRPIGFFEKLHPPPLPPKNLQNIRRVPTIENDLIPRPLTPKQGDDVPKKSNSPDPFGYLQNPPKIVIANRRSDIDEDILDHEVETLQMIQAKKDVKKNPAKNSFKTNLSGKDNVEKPLYVVYPVNTSPLKLDVIDGNKKEAVVVGTRAELPLPPSKIGQEQHRDDSPTKIRQEFNFEMNERHDSPILKPHHRFPIKSDFPYPLERPDPSIFLPAVPDTPNNNKIDGHENVKLPDEPSFISSNQWNTIENTESRIVTGGKPGVSHNSNQISVTLKTYTEKQPIALAYSPTERPYAEYSAAAERYSMPNLGSVVIPEIRPDSFENRDSEFTVSAVMHTHSQMDTGTRNKQKIIEKLQNDREKDESLDEEDNSSPVPQLDFQAPFQASAHIDHTISQGWAVVRDKPRDDGLETTTQSVIVTSEFDMENFKPQLEGGFRPIYSFPEDKENMHISEREE